MRFLLAWLVIFLSAGQAQCLSPRDARYQAIDRSLAFLYKTASDDAAFSRFGSDLLWCLFSISHTDRDRKLRVSAAQMGRRFALLWREKHRHVPPTATADEIYLMLEGSYAADRLGVPDPQFKSELRRAVPRYQAADYLRFDPLRGPPALDDLNRYDIFCDALIRSYFGDAYGIPLGAHYRDVVKWLPRLRPYDGHDEDTEFDIFYAVTHLIYTLNDYNERGVAISLLPDEFSFLRRKLKEAINERDSEMVGEALDCLKSASLANDPDVLAGEEYLIRSQLPDGSWISDPDQQYTVFHAVWTGIDGLRDYSFHGEVKKLPKALKSTLSASASP